MVKLINRFTGTEMWVADERLDDYLKLGHEMADAKPADDEPEPNKTTKKASKKK